MGVCLGVFVVSISVLGPRGGCAGRRRRRRRRRSSPTTEEVEEVESSDLCFHQTYPSIITALNDRVGKHASRE